VLAVQEALTGKAPRAGTATDPAATAFHVVRDTVFPNLANVTDTESMGVGSGFEIVVKPPPGGRVTGALKLSLVENERIGREQRERFSEFGVGSRSGRSRRRSKGAWLHGRSSEEAPVAWLAAHFERLGGLALTPVQADAAGLWMTEVYERLQPLSPDAATRLFVARQRSRMALRAR
jgi:hypothetical protein